MNLKKYSNKCLSDDVWEDTNIQLNEVTKKIPDLKAEFNKEIE